MRFLKQATFISFFILAASLPSKAACIFPLHEMLGTLFADGTDSRINIIPGKRYLVSRGWKDLPNEYRYVNAFAILNPTDDLENIAKMLSQGRPHQELYQKLLKKVKTPNTKIAFKEFAPEVAKKMNNKVALCRGPNCWNATANWYDPSVGLVHTSALEMEDFLQRNFFKLYSVESLKFGDTIVVRSERGQIIHSAIYINKDIVWHKGGMNDGTYWTLVPFKDAFWGYRQLYGNLHFNLYRHNTLSSEVVGKMLTK